MARKCAVLKCRSGYKQKKSVFKFPVEKTRRQKWIELLKPLKPISLDYSGVCELHFSTESFCEEAQKPEARKPEELTEKICV